jgi:hypothetical protein
LTGSAESYRSLRAKQRRAFEPGSQLYGRNPPPRRWRRLFADIQLRHKFSAVLPKRHHTCGTRLRMILRSYGICSAPIRIELSTR